MWRPGQAAAGARGEGQGASGPAKKTQPRLLPSTSPLTPCPSPLAQPKAKRTIDPTYLAKARELRDRWMERANEVGLIGGTGGKYDVSRALQSAIRDSTELPEVNPRSAMGSPPLPLLKAG